MVSPSCGEGKGQKKRYRQYFTHIVKVRAIGGAAASARARPRPQARLRQAGPGGDAVAVRLLQDGFTRRFDPAAGAPRVAVKDLIDVAGLLTTGGSAALADAAPADRDAAVVASLRDAGAAIVGKSALHELGRGTSGVNAWSGTPRNPLDPALVPGGSSSGSAVAVAVAAADLALGTDTGGSIRIPAACCGVVGLKPTQGRLSADGLVPSSTGGSQA